SELNSKLNNQDNKEDNQAKKELEQQIQQLTADLKQANEKKPSKNNGPENYSDIKVELEQLRKQAANSKDSEWSRKMMESLDKMLAREREREREQRQASHQSIGIYTE